ADFVQKPRIFHRDYRLGREILQQRDLLFGKRPHFLTENYNRPHQRVIFSKANREAGSCPGEVDQSAAVPVADSVDIGSRQIRHMDDSLSLEDSPRPRSRPIGPRILTYELCVRHWYSAQRRMSEILAVIGE